MILVTGATGNAGGGVVRALLDAGEPVRGLLRDESQASKLPNGAEGAVGDLNRSETLAGPLEGVSAVFLLSGYDDMPDTLARMREAGVERVVLLSGSGAAGDDLDNAVARYQILSQGFVRDSGLPWTFLQPNSFMANTLQWSPQLQAGDVVRAPFADVPVSVIDPYDIGAVAVQALTTAAHEGRTYRLSGPDALLPAQRLEILARVLGRDLRFEAQTDDEARAEMSAAMPEEYVDAFFSFFVDGTVDETTVHPTVREITGREPHTFEHWATAHAGAFR
jgi:uncharacterized protein YbjT (DUF2867 family)